MIIDIGELAESEVLEAAVCVIGAGPTGLALARELAAGGVATVLVESGGREPAADSAVLDRGRSVGADGLGLTEGRARALGGAARLWAGQCLPLEPLDYTERDWIPDSGWPISEPELRPYVERAESFFKVTGEPHDARVWESFGLSPYPFDPALLTHLATVYTPQPDLGARFEGELERAAGLRVLLRATATRVDAGDGGTQVSGVTVRGLDGREATIRARTVVLCAGAIENARLLLLSGGLGNDHDLVGRYFQDHPNARVATIATAAPLPLLDHYALLYRKPFRYFPKIGLAPELQRRSQAANAIANLVFDFGQDSGLEALKRLYRSRRGGEPTDVRRDALRVARELPRLARNVPRVRSGLSPAAAVERVVLQVHVEQFPDRDSRVTLAAETDRLGMPLAEVDWRINPADVETVRTMTRAVGEEIGRLGLGEVRPEPWLEDPGNPLPLENFSGAFHYLGTTRMSERPQEGVVDRDCRVHGVDGLYCCGGSVFPAGGAANPTLAMVALSLRLSEHLLAAARAKPAPLTR